jgi:outer membrane putative beta-barrel porin/alpha-amylase
MLPERLSIEGGLSVTRARDQVGRLFVRLAQGFTGVYTLTAHLEAFADWYAFYAANAGGAGTGAQHYAVGGLVYVLTPHVALDIRAGGGLTKAAEHFFAGAGLALRYYMPFTFRGDGCRASRIVKKLKTSFVSVL